MRTVEVAGARVLVFDEDGPLIATSADASDLIGTAWSENATVLAVPVARLSPDFFALSTGFAGELTQKVVNYRLRLAVLGDVRPFTASSGAFADWVWESNRGGQIWFLDDEAALVARLAPAAPPAAPTASPTE